MARSKRRYEASLASKVAREVSKKWQALASKLASLAHASGLHCTFPALARGGLDSATGHGPS